MEKKRETFDFATDLASLRPQLVRRAEGRWSKRFWREQSPEDFASETICAVYASRENFRGKSVAELGDYAQTTLDRLICNCARRIQARGQHEPFRPSEHMPPKGGTTPSGKLLKIERKEEFARFLSGLTLQERRAYELVRSEGKSRREAAAEMGVPEYKVGRLLDKVEEKLGRFYKNR